jgi:oligopeptide/dipeptide ABC transporter ATP-binding protein
VNDNTPLLEVEHLAIGFPSERGWVRVVDDLSFRLVAGECLAIVGESGSGKSMTARALVDLVPIPGRVVGGSVRLNGQEVLTLPDAAMRSIRGAEIGMIFQDPTSALNPVLTIGRQLTDAIRAHGKTSRSGARIRALQVLDEVGLPGTEHRLRMYPFELSGGLRQRVSIAMALVSRPKIVIADEATTNLDVSIQAQILDLLARLKEQSGFGIIMISHDLGVVASLADRLLVVYAGRAVEHGPTLDTLRHPRHPYTRALLSCAPTLRSTRRSEPLAAIQGTAPSPADVGPGCPFAPRCPERLEGICDQIAPPTIRISESAEVVCHLFQEDRNG